MRLMERIRTNSSSTCSSSRRSLSRYSLRKVIEAKYGSVISRLEQELHLFSAGRRRDFRGVFGAVNR